MWWGGLVWGVQRSLHLLLDGDADRLRVDGATVSHLDDGRLLRRMVRAKARGQELRGGVGTALVVRAIGGSLQVHLPPQHAQHLLLQHGLRLHAALQLVQPLGVLAHVEALDLLVDALQLVQVGL